MNAKKLETNEFVLERTHWSEEKTEGYSYGHYGFIVYRRDGRSLPKGWISSMNAVLSKPDSNSSRFLDDHVEIEFGMQAPTGDASDHCHYVIPCATWGQACKIVDAYHEMMQVAVKAYEDKQTYLYS